MRQIIFVLVLPLILFAFAAIKQLKFTQKAVATITDDRLVEASGLEESYTNPGHFWTHNDSGSKSIIFLIDQAGKIKMEVKLKGVKNRDWEEIVTVKIGGSSYIYVAEIGDNRAAHDEIRFICLEEPIYDGDSKIEVEEEDLKVMHLQYAEGARDAEAAFYDYGAKEFVLVTKREKNAMVYSFTFEENTAPKVIHAEGTVPDNQFTAADMNEQGEILLKDYKTIYFWSAASVRAAERILDWNPASIAYKPEPQGEAICWFKQNFFTISEKNKDFPQELQLFKRVD